MISVSHINKESINKILLQIKYIQIYSEVGTILNEQKFGN